ncbi:MAG: C39 family peptidase [bacterium]
MKKIVVMYIVAFLLVVGVIYLNIYLLLNTNNTKLSNAPINNEIIQNKDLDIATSSPSPSPTSSSTPSLTPVPAVIPEVVKEDKKEVMTDIVLPVPYVSEAPEGIWKGTWINGCEEASITMVEKYYKMEDTVSVADAKEFMLMLFETQDKLYGSNANSDAERTNKLINDYTGYNGFVVENPTVDSIKKELQEGRPVISFHRGFDLKNKNIPFLATGSSFHVLVIVGYDDTTGEFITQDNGDPVSGVHHRYEYKLFMNSIHDYNFKRKLADDVPRVIFTSNKKNNETLQ